MSLNLRSLCAEAEGEKLPVHRENDEFMHYGLLILYLKSMLIQTKSVSETEILEGLVLWDSKLYCQLPGRLNIGKICSKSIN